MLTNQHRTRDGSRHGRPAPAPAARTATGLSVPRMYRPDGLACLERQAVIAEAVVAARQAAQRAPTGPRGAVSLTTTRA
jgi:hypothetical protein